MESSNVRRFNKQAAYYMWAGVFFLLVFAVLLGIYYSTKQIDYVWGWSRIPQYFMYDEMVETRSEIGGTVDSVLVHGQKAVIRIKGKGEEGSYTVPARSIRVSEGDMIFVGDVLEAHKERQWGLLLVGLWITLKVSVIAVILGILLGILTGLARISSNPVLKWSSITYIELIRGSPLLVQIFIWYFVLGTLINKLLEKNGFEFLIPGLWFGIAALACFAGAYVAEIVRAGIQSIHRGQTEAARSLGMTYVQCMGYVILPQAMRRILPPLAGQFISLIKDSSLLGAIAIRELTKATREGVSSSFMTFELWFVCAILYLVLTFSLSMILQYVERRI
ncbi:ABC transporter permease subunit [Desulfococcaceae bacterium HSG8]|nr:ABC transporter permease subunit [Desulfococcaceae bacterium HSG8]